MFSPGANAFLYSDGPAFFRRGLSCEKILELVWNCNKLIDETTPWKQFKAGKQEAVNETLYTLLESVRIAVYLLSPITPQLSISAYQQLGLTFDETSPPDWSHANWGILESGKPISTPVPIFQRIEA